MKYLKLLGRRILKLVRLWSRTFGRRRRKNLCLSGINCAFDRPSTLVIHTGTNDIEHSTLESCFDNFQTLIDLSAQKYPATKIIISSLITRNDGYDTKRSQLNNKISQLRFYANVHFVNNENITQEMLYDRKHIKKRKIATLVANLKDCIFNRISRRPHPERVP